ncbi:MAG: hypothetical protein ABII98_01505 [bacterium]
MLARRKKSSALRERGHAPPIGRGAHLFPPPPSRCAPPKGGRPGVLPRPPAPRAGAGSSARFRKRTEEVQNSKKEKEMRATFLPPLPAFPACSSGFCENRAFKYSTKRMKSQPPCSPLSLQQF